MFRCAAVSLAGVIVSPAAPAQPPADIPFDHIVIDDQNSGSCKGLGDLDGDGFPDAVLGGEGALRWYHYPEWTPTLIAASDGEFSTDMQLADIDGDGDLDIVVPNGPTGLLGWYRNPRPDRPADTPGWDFVLIGTAGNWVHDVAIADFNGDTRPDIVAGDHIVYDVWIQNPFGRGSTAAAWTRATIAQTDGGTGVSTGDIDGDGRPDVCTGPSWLRTPIDPINGAWVRRTIATDWPAETASVVIDMDGDGRRDVVIAATESTGRLSWYKAPADPLGDEAWTERPILSSLDFVHAFFVRDMNRDGALDIVFAEMAQSVNKRVGIVRGTPGSAGAGPWTLQVIATTGSHNIRVGDIGADGDLDILGANWQGPPLEAWINRTDPRTARSLALAAAPPAPPTPPPPSSIAADLSAFASRWFTSLTHGTLDADFDGDRAITPADLSAFASARIGATLAPRTTPQSPLLPRNPHRHRPRQ